MVISRKSIINLVSLSLALVSIALSVFFYQRSKRERDPRYLIYEPPTVVFDSGTSDPTIQVTGPDGKTIQETIRVVTVSFWNAGQLPIEPEDVRQPPRFSISNTSRVLSAKVTAENYPGISQFKASPLPSQEGSKHSDVELTWKHLDPGHGARFQVMYVSNASSSFKLEGNIVGTNGPKSADALFGKAQSVTPAASALLGVGLAAAIIWLLKRAEGRDSKRARFLAIALVFTIVSAVVVIGSFVIAWLVEPIQPPI
jgi:hypothetical protein